MIAHSAEDSRRLEQFSVAGIKAMELSYVICDLFICTVVFGPLILGPETVCRFSQKIIATNKFWIFARSLQRSITLQFVVSLIRRCGM